jgi:hypothetical protein
MWETYGDDMGETCWNDRHMGKDDFVRGFFRGKINISLIPFSI